MSSPESASPTQSNDQQSEGASKVAFVSFVLSSDPSEIVIMELVGSRDMVITGQRAVVLGGIDDGDLYTRVPSMFMSDPIHVNRQQIAFMAKPSDALVRLHQRFWAWWGNNTAANEASLNKFMAREPASSQSEVETGSLTTGSRTIH